VRVTGLSAGTYLLVAVLSASPAAAQPSSAQPESRRHCAVCHVEWMEGFTRPGAVLLMAPPAEPQVAESHTCLGCHDGSVGDSRRRVWIEHGHKTGVEPPASMQVPRQLPLKEGKIDCRTCHSAHAGAGAETLATAVFLRVPNDAGQLCQMCHPQYAKGPELGTHPVGGMPWLVPEELIVAGARVGPDRFRLTCLTCHTPHGAREHDLLVMGTESSQLCLSCHTKLRPGMWRPDLEREHPQNPPLSTDEQRQAIRDMGTKTGPGETLICLSCHKLHHGLGGRDMLADTLEESRLCLRCHGERRPLLDSPHDLRRSAAEERNRLGRTAEQSGPCGACHSFHQFARRPEPGVLDPTGLCTTCHRPGQCGEKAPGLPFSHPSDVDLTHLPAAPELKLYSSGEDPSRRAVACLTCHDPHETRHAHFLREEPDSLCAKCHSDKAATLAGGHDFTTQPEVRNARERTAADVGKCGFCHGVHNAGGPALWVATTDSPADPDDLCVQCHRAGGLAAGKPQTQFRHPTGPATLAAARELVTTRPLFDDDGRRCPDGSVACASCHDPHATADHSPALLRAGPPTSALCTSCHSEQALLAGGLHDPRVAPHTWPQTAVESQDQCLACHQAHSNDPARMLWTVAPLPEFASSDGACLACHRHTEWGGYGTGPEPGTTLHPRVMTLDNDVHGLPLVPDEAGRTSGAIGCKTCHNPHAPKDGPPHLLRSGQNPDPAAMCLRCHHDVQYIGMSLHSREALREHPATSQVCGPCHVVHAVPGTSVAGMWAAPQVEGAQPPDVGRCLGCHGPGGSAAQAAAVEHPAVALENVDPPGAAGYMPLVDAQGRINGGGRIACITCHMPHGRPPGLGFPSIDPTRVSQDQIRHMMPMLRPYVAPNLCSSCHGFDGLRRYLYYHQPEKRRGAPATQQSAGPRPAASVGGS